jgi:hypothetical protein
MTRSNRPFAAIALLTLAGFAACRGDSQVLAEFDGGKVTRGDLRSAFKNAPQIPGIEMQDRVLGELALIRMIALEARNAKLDQTEDFKKRAVFLEKTAFVGALEQILVDQGKKAKFKMLEVQFAFLRDAGETKKRKQEAEDLLGRLNKSSDSERDRLVASRTEMDAYKDVAGYADPVCVSCEPNPVPFLTKALEKSGDAFVMAEEASGIWIVRRVKEKEYEGDDLAEAMESYWKNAMRTARATIAAMPDGPEKKEKEARVMGESAIENLAKQQAEQYVSTNSRGALQRRLDERRRKIGFEPQPGLADWFKAQDAAQPAREIPAVKFGEKTLTVGDLLDMIPAGIAPDPRQVVNTILTYELLKDDELAGKAKSSDFYVFLKEWNENNQLALLYLNKESPVKVTDAKIAERHQLLFRDKPLTQVRAQIVAEIERQEREAIMRQMKESLGKKFNLKIHRDKLKGDEI